MKKNAVVWKPVKRRNVRGAEYHSRFPDVINRNYRGTLICRILEMPAGTSIAFKDAVKMCEDEYHAARRCGRIGSKPGECFWFYQNFVSWISDQGFHIELTGDEFEPYAMSDKVA